MPIAWKCRGCKGVFAEEGEGACSNPKCRGFYRRIRIIVGDDEVSGAAEAMIEEGEPISAGDLMKIAESEGMVEKLPTGLAGVDHVFDGGLPKVASILLCAPAGTGKSTFLLVLFRELAKRGVASLYINAEQTLTELAQQFAWLGKFPKKMLMHHATDKDDIIETIEKYRAKVYAVDSLHDVRNVTDASGFELADSGTRTVSQVGAELRALAGKRGAVIFAIGHVNNDGTIAGGANVRHKLDAVLTLRQWPGLTEQQRERDPRRILQFEGKTRFGRRGRRALFEMRDDGLIDCGPLLDDNEPDDNKIVPIRPDVP